MAKKPEEGFHQLTDEVLKKLINDRVDGQTPITFSEEEYTYILRVINIIKAFDTLGSLGTILKNVFIALATVMATYAAIKGGFIGWLKAGLS
jgi:hypothetical protein